MKKNHILGFVALVLIAGFGACKKAPIMDEPEEPSAPTFVAGAGVPTMVFTPAVTALFIGDFFDKSGGHKISGADVIVTPDNGSKLTDMTNLVLSFRKENGLDSVVIPFPVISSNTITVDLAQYGMILATNQNVQVRVQAHVNPVHKGTFRIAVRLRYSGPSGPGTLSQSGPIVNCHAGGISVEILGGKSIKATVVGNRDTLQTINITTYGSSQSLEFSYDAEGAYKNETLRSLSLVDEQGVQLGNTAPNFVGKFLFSGIVQDTMKKKTYYVVSDLNSDAPTGYEFTVKLRSIRSRDLITGIFAETTHGVVGNKFVAYGVNLLVATNPTPARLVNGEQVIASATYTAKSGSGWLSQFKDKIVIAGNGSGTLVTIGNFKLRVNGVTLAKELVFFSKANGDTLKVHTESDEIVHTTLLGGYFLPKDMPVTIELIGTIKGVAGVGDAIATTLVISDPLDLQNRYVVRDPSQRLARLYSSPSNSSNGIVYDFIWSDNSAVPHSGTFGISSDDHFNGHLVSTKNVRTTILQ